MKNFAPCYQSSPTAGDAACSYNGTVYGSGAPFAIPSGGSSSASSASSATASSGTALPTGTGVAPIYPTGANSTGAAGPTGGATSAKPSAPAYTGAASANTVGGALAALGLAAAALL